MKKTLFRFCLLLLLSAMTLSCFTSCVKGTSDPEKFENVYASPYVSSPNMLSFSPYAYYSYLLLFPRTAPKQLQDFRTVFRQGFGVDHHLFYFSYETDPASFAVLAEKMKNFTVTAGSETRQVITDATHFSYPAVILSFPKDEKAKNAPYEYLLLDTERHTVISVFSLNLPDKELKKYIPSDYLPNDLAEARSSLSSFSEGEENFSVYAFPSEEGSVRYPPIGDLRFVDLFHTEGIDW